MRLMNWLRVLMAGSVLAAGCATGSISGEFECSDDQIGQWQIPAGWLDRELTSTQARAEVLTANLSKPSAESRWDELRIQWMDGDRYWLYVRPEEDTLNALGVQRGVVLIRGCEQLGFVTTRIETETVRATGP